MDHGLDSPPDGRTSVFFQREAGWEGDWGREQGCGRASTNQVTAGLLTFELAWSPEMVRRGHEKSLHCKILSPPRQPVTTRLDSRCRALSLTFKNE